MTARNIRANAGVEVVNVDHHILELQDDRELRLELFVNKGRGFVLAEQHAIPRGSPADLVRIDAIYNPVRRANFVVEDTRVGQRTDFDRLVLEVETNGSIDVPTAVQYAAQLAIEHFSFLAGSRPEWSDERQWGASGGNGSGHGSAATRTPVPARVEELLRRPVEEVGELSIRSLNALKKENIQTIRKLVERTEEQMRGIDGFGPKSLQEIGDLLAAQGLRFGIKVEEENGTLYWDGGQLEGSDDSGSSNDNG